MGLGSPWSFGSLIIGLDRWIRVVHLPTLARMDQVLHLSYFSLAIIQRCHVIVRIIVSQKRNDKLVDPKVLHFYLQALVDSIDFYYDHHSSLMKSVSLDQ